VGWVQRGKYRYYERSRKVNGQVTKEYFGRGPAAVGAAREDAQRREKRELDRHEYEQGQDAHAQAAQVAAMADVLVRAHLLTNGLHEYHGEWRQRRHVTRHEQSSAKKKKEEK
jgi:hypothetical protein